MVNISSLFIDSKTDFLSSLQMFFQNFYQITDIKTQECLNYLDDRLLQKFENNLKFHFEYPYVDKVYRDTFYNYYSSKNNDYDRNSIKVSIFNGSFDSSNIYDDSEILQNYLGFFTIRPTFPNILGRNLINPFAFKNVNDILICNSNYSVTFNSLKINIDAFPHSSQDGEAMTCAETTIWSLIEYFSNKYNEYRPLLPNDIHEILKELTVERQIPSQGLAAHQISFALKKVGFGVKVYNKNAYGLEFDKILKTYINSGIPMVAIVNNNSGICHAFNIIGKVNPSEADIFAVVSEDVRKDGSLNVYDLIDADKKIVIIDDNFSPYQIGEITSPCNYYNNNEWNNCVITDIIVPLYTKIYMDAGQAKKISINFIKLCSFAYLAREIYIKTFLCSSRSYKNYVFALSDMDIELKKILLNFSMPKFIWITEVFDKTRVTEGKVEGLLIIDATEPNKANVIGAIFENKLIVSGLKTEGVYDLNTIGITTNIEFTSYNKNLTTF